MHRELPEVVPLRRPSYDPEPAQQVAIRCRGSGATPPGSPTETAESHLEVAAELQRLLSRTRKRRHDIVEHEAIGELEATSLLDEQTSWEREAAPSPSSWLALANVVDEAELPLPLLTRASPGIANPIQSQQDISRKKQQQSQTIDGISGQSTKGAVFRGDP